LFRRRPIGHALTMMEILIILAIIALAVWLIKSLR
jgi:Tfp pilus assembly protein FimT